MHRSILRLAVPNILSNISVPLLSSFDTALMGRMSADHLGAVGLGGMVFNFLYWNFGFLRMGSTGLTAQAYGRQDAVGSAQVLGQATVVALALAMLLLLGQSQLLQVSQALLQVPANQQALVAEYFHIRIWAAPAALALYALLGWYFGMQNAIYPLILTLVINICNMALSYYLVQTAGWGIAGVAWGTVVAQYLGLVVGIILLLWRYPEVPGRLRSKLLFQWQALRLFLRINRDIFLRTLCLTLSFAIFYRVSAGLGDMILAANVILLQYVNWMSYGVDGFAYAAESLVGKFHGAKDTPSLQRAIRLSFGWGMLLATLYTCAYLVGGENLLLLFTDQAEVVATALPYLPWVVIFPILGTPCYIWDGTYVGLTASRAMRDTMLLAFGGYLLLYYAFGQSWGNDGLWLSLLGFMVLRGMLQWRWSKRLPLAAN